MNYAPFNWYETPLYYDIIFDAGTAEEADFLEAVHDRYGDGRCRSVLEPACGSGRLLGEMARRGMKVAGVDINKEMLAFARRRLREAGLKTRLIEAPMQSFRGVAGIDLAHCLVSSFKYLPDEASARSHLECVARALRPGGLYVLGLHLADYDDDRRTRERWVEKRSGVEVVCNIQAWPADRATRIERLRSRLVVRRWGGDVKRYETTWSFRTYDRDQLARLLRSVPDLEHVATHDFTYRIDRPVPFDGEHLDVVLVLRGSNAPS